MPTSGIGPISGIVDTVSKLPDNDSPIGFTAGGYRLSDTGST